MLSPLLSLRGVMMRCITTPPLPTSHPQFCSHKDTEIFMGPGCSSGEENMVKHQSQSSTSRRHIMIFSSFRNDACCFVCYKVHACVYSEFNSGRLFLPELNSCFPLTVSSAAFQFESAQPSFTGRVMLTVISNYKESTLRPFC